MKSKMQSLYSEETEKKLFSELFPQFSFPILRTQSTGCCDE